MILERATLWIMVVYLVLAIPYLLKGSRITQPTTTLFSAGYYLCRNPLDLKCLKAVSRIFCWLLSDPSSLCTQSSRVELLLQINHVLIRVLFFVSLLCFLSYAHYTHLLFLLSVLYGGCLENFYYKMAYSSQIFLNKEYFLWVCVFTTIRYVSNLF